MVVGYRRRIVIRQRTGGMSLTKELRPHHITEVNQSRSHGRRGSVHGLHEPAIFVAASAMRTSVPTALAVPKGKCFTVYTIIFTIVKINCCYLALYQHLNHEPQASRKQSRIRNYGIMTCSDGHVGGAVDLIHDR